MSLVVQGVRPPAFDFEHKADREEPCNLREEAPEGDRREVCPLAPSLALRKEVASARDQWFAFMRARSEENVGPAPNWSLLHRFERRP